MSGIAFSGEPVYGNNVSIMVLSPAGIDISVEEIGRHLFGAHHWTTVDPPAISALPRELTTRPGFRLSEQDVDWTEFLQDCYSVFDFVLYYNPFKTTYAEVTRNTLSYQKPVYYSFTALAFHSASFLPLKKSETGISEAALAPPSAFTTPRPLPAARKSAAKEKPASSTGRNRPGTAAPAGAITDPNVICVDLDALTTALDGMLLMAHEAMAELNILRRSLR